MKTWQKRVRKCQKKHRPKLKNWQKDGFAVKENEKITRFYKLLQRESGISYNRLLLRSNSLTHLLTYSLTHLLTHSLTHSLAYYTGIVDVDAPRRRQYTAGNIEESLDRIDCKNITHKNFIDFYEKPYVLTHSLTHSLTRLQTYSLTHKLTHPLTHSLTNSLNPRFH